MKKIVVFSGAGISKESGVSTFRDSNGLWDNYDIKDVAHPSGWKKDRLKVLDFYNKARKHIQSCSFNSAHRGLCDLEDKYDVTIFTQNIDPFHEMSGSSKVFHLHGEILKARSTANPTYVYEWDKDITLKDRCEIGSQLRPHTVWFGEFPYHVEDFITQISECDILIVVGTSLNIEYTVDVLKSVYNRPIDVYYIDPNPSDDKFHHKINYIRKNATQGIKELLDIL